MKVELWGKNGSIKAQGQVLRMCALLVDKAGPISFKMNLIICFSCSYFVPMKLGADVLCCRSSEGFEAT